MGQTISISHLAPFVRISEEKLRRETIQNFKDAGVEYTNEQVEVVVKNLLKKEIKDSMQTLQYQINTLS